MALNAKSMFLYGYSVGVSNSNLDFIGASGGPTLTAQVALGDYSLSSLLTAIKVAMESADPAHIYTITADRTLMGGTQNRVTISTNGSFLTLLFATGPNATTSVANLIGFNPMDYTGQTAYIGTTTTGTVLIPDYLGYGFNYQDPSQQAKVFGAVNVSSAGIKEAVVFNIQSFMDVEFMYEPKSRLAEWQQLFYWMIQQKPFDFTPEITSPTVTLPLTLEKTAADGKGLGYLMKEMLPNFPNFYQTGAMNFRVVLDYNAVVFIS